MFSKKSTETKPGSLANETEYLQNVIDCLPDTIQVFQACRDQYGKIIDFIWLAQNKKGFEQNGDATGKSVLQQNPGMVVSGIFDRMRIVVETGNPHEQEQYYSFEQFPGNWYSLTLVKFADGIIMVTKDITHYKNTQQELAQLKEKFSEREKNKYT